VNLGSLVPVIAFLVSKPEVTVAELEVIVTEPEVIVAKPEVTWNDDAKPSNMFKSVEKPSVVRFTSSYTHFFGNFKEILCKNALESHIAFFPLY